MIDKTLYGLYDKSVPVVPYNISKYGVYSGQIMLVYVILALYYKQYYLSGLGIVLYITTMLYWRNIQKWSNIKSLDIFVVVCFVLLITFYYAPKYFTESNRTVWHIMVILTLLIYLFNNVIWYYQVLQYYNIYKPEQYMNKSYSYFSLDYTNPATVQRDLANLYSTLVHCVFIHIVPCMTYGYCLIMS